MCYIFFSNLSKTYKLYYYFSFFIIIFLPNAKQILSNEFICLLWKHERDIPAKFGSNWPSGFGEEA